MVKESVNENEISIKKIFFSFSCPKDHFTQKLKQRTPFYSQGFFLQPIIKDRLKKLFKKNLKRMQFFSGQNDNFFYKGDPLKNGAFFPITFLYNSIHFVQIS